METLGEINELLTTKMCSPVIVYAVVLVISAISVYLCRRTLQRYNTQKMENLYTLFTMQELKFMLILGVTMYGLCQYNKSDLAWIFLIFPIIYVVIQNTLLYIHVSSALQNAPQDKPRQGSSYGAGMQAPLNEAKPQTIRQQPSPESHVLPKSTSQSFPLGGGNPGIEPFNL